MPKYDPHRQFGPNEQQLPSDRSGPIRKIADTVPPIGGLPEQLPNEDMQWFWEWEALTRKDPAWGGQWQSFFRGATGIDPMTLGVSTPQEALEWQRKRKTDEFESFRGVPESRNVQVGSEPTITDAMSRWEWMAENLKLQAQGRLQRDRYLRRPLHPTMAGLGLEATDVDDLEAIENIRRYSRITAPLKRFPVVR